MPIGPSSEDRYEFDPEYARRVDEQMDLANKDLDAAFKSFEDHTVAYFVLLPLAAGAFVALNVARPFYAITKWRQSRKSA